MTTGSFISHCRFTSMVCVCVCVLVDVRFRVPGFQNKLQMFPLWCGREEGATSCWLMGGGEERAGWSGAPPAHGSFLTQTHTHNPKINCSASNDQHLCPHNAARSLKGGVLPGSKSLRCNLSKSTSPVLQQQQQADWRTAENRGIMCCAGLNQNSNS